MTREEAIATGAKRYSTEKPCRHGHLSARYVDNRDCVECRRIRISSWKARNSERVRKQNIVWMTNNKARHAKTTAEWQVNNKLRKSGQRRAWHEANRERVREMARAWKRGNLQDKLRNALRCRLRGALRRNQKKASAVNDLGISIDEFKAYIERQFVDGMAWDNWTNIWQLDHKVALCRFDLADKEQAKQALHFTNYQPLLLNDHFAKTITDCRLSLRRKSHNDI